MIVKKKFTGTNRVGQPRKYNFAALNPGECLIIPFEKHKHKDDWLVLKSRVSAAFHTYKKKHNPDWVTAVKLNVENPEKIVCEAYRIK